MSDTTQTDDTGSELTGILSQGASSVGKATDEAMQILTQGASSVGQAAGEAAGAALQPYAFGAGQDAAQGALTTAAPYLVYGGIALFALWLLSK